MYRFCRFLFIVASICIVSGCAWFQGAAGEYDEKSVALNTAALQVALYRICVSGSVESVETFFDSEDLMAARDTICARYRSGAERGKFPAESSE